MAKISAADGVKLYVEAIGSGTPVVFVHEYAGDYRSWEPQMRHFCRQHASPIVSADIRPRTCPPIPRATRRTSPATT